ncbi:MAG: 5-(carboxyamino)imidazole ribonucleotide mutase [Deltaproteobacteria bacterium]|nr:5-(carboxyamino)imidazole ribonucleotide mutase [Deltaproteobacteria bacterium]
MGSSSDLAAMQPAADVLAELGVPVEVRALSAHRSPEQAIEFARSAAKNGFKVLICGAGGAAHLAGVVAAHALLPVIGVPLARSLGGLDALYSTVQMPPGIPVATVAIDGALNAGLLAATILALGDPLLATRLRARREETTGKVLASDDEVREKGSRLLD